MKEYPKIQSVFKRDSKTHKFIEGDWSIPELGYLSRNIWRMTEKIDGTNIRVQWSGERFFQGKTDNAQIPKPLLNRLQNAFPEDLLQERFPNAEEVCLYGEGYGAGIQKGGKYIPVGVDFILFDVWIDGWWLRDSDVDDIANQLGIRSVPYIATGTIYDAIALIKKGVQSTFGDFLAEGLVLKPIVPLLTRSGNRVITKIKHRDF